MFEFIVLEIQLDGSINGLGCRKFKAQPRTGEYMSTDDDSGSAIYYKVVDVVHPMDENLSTAGDIFVKKVYSASEDNNINIFNSKLAKGEI